MSLREDLTGQEHDEIGTCLDNVLSAVKEGRMAVSDANGWLRQIIGAALMQNPGFISQVRTVSGKASDA
jgi:UPF0716 family protein affecting phage T7 exclusion